MSALASLCSLGFGNTILSFQVYDVTAIRVKDVAHGTVGKPVTFLGKLSVLIHVYAYQ